MLPFGDVRLMLRFILALPCLLKSCVAPENKTFKYLPKPKWNITRPSRKMKEGSMIASIAAMSMDKG